MDTYNSQAGINKGVLTIQLVVIVIMLAYGFIQDRYDKYAEANEVDYHRKYINRFSFIMRSPKIIRDEVVDEKESLWKNILFYIIAGLITIILLALTIAVPKLIYWLLMLSSLVLTGFSIVFVVTFLRSKSKKIGETTFRFIILNAIMQTLVMMTAADILKISDFMSKNTTTAANVIDLWMALGLVMTFAGQYALSLMIKRIYNIKNFRKSKYQDQDLKTKIYNSRNIDRLGLNIIFVFLFGIGPYLLINIYKFL